MNNRKTWKVLCWNVWGLNAEKNGTLSRIKSKKATVIFSACKKLKKHPLIYILSGKFAHQHLMPLNSLRQMEPLVEC
jgi:hypothetical protein